MREMLLSPDGNKIAIRSDQEDPEAWNAWGVFSALHGGHWSATSELWGWTVLTATEEVLVNPAPPVEEFFDEPYEGDPA